MHISAIGAAADSPSAYARSKAAGEAALLAAFPAATILRPSIVFGPEDSFFNRFAAMAAIIPCVFPVVSGATRFQPVHVADVADAVMAALEREDTAGRIYELGGPRVWTMRELMAFVLAHRPQALAGGDAARADAPAGAASREAAASAADARPAAAACAATTSSPPTCRALRILASCRRRRRQRCRPISPATVQAAGGGAAA